MNEPRPYTTDEIRTMFLEQIWATVRFWQHSGVDKSVALEGVAHSILAMMDGCTLELPGFAIVPVPHPDDKDYYISEGKNWFPPSDFDDDVCDIGGGLHELFYGAKH